MATRGWLPGKQGWNQGFDSKQVLVKSVRHILLALVPVCILAALPLRAEPATAIDRAFDRLYNFDFAGTRAILDEHRHADPADPLAYSVQAAADLFAEMYRLKILETDFFIDNSKLGEKKKLKPDPAVRAAIFTAVEEARQRAQAKLAPRPDDRDALFALCMSASVVTDYTMLVERRQWAALRLARETQSYALKLLALNPPAYDAYHTLGMMEYVMGSVPFFVRWFIRYDQIQGSKQKGIQNLYMVVKYGRYYRPFARILLSVIYLPEKKPEESQKVLAELARDFPANQLIRMELAKVTEQLQRTATSGGKAQ